MPGPLAMKRTRAQTRRHLGPLASVAFLAAFAPWFQGCQDSSEGLPGPVSGSIVDLEVATYQTVTTHVVDGASDAMAPELSWEWAYDAEDRLTEVIGPGGVVTRVSHSALEAAPDGGAEAGARRVFARDADGRLLSASGSDDEMFFRYYATGMPAEVRSDGVPVLRYFYDVEDRLTEMRIGDAAAIRYGYDYLGRPAQVTTPVGDITYTYDRASNGVVRRLPNGVRTSRQYDDEGKLVELTHIDADNYLIAGFVYTYRPDGLIAGVVETTRQSGERACRYDYDLMHRLVAVECSGAGRSYRYSYDELGNLAEVQMVGAPPLRLENAPTGALVSDSRGAARVDDRGHIRRLPGVPEAIDYDFNLTGELAGARAQSLQYRYNALGLLTTRSVDGQETTYLPDPFADGWQPLWRRGPDENEAVVIWDGAVPLLELEGDEVRFRLEDHLGSVRTEVDGSGSITAWYDYSPFGAPDGAEIGSGLRPGFAGLYWDPGAQVYHATARAYDPVTGRFLQPDPQLRVPEASKLSHSLYAYSGGDPVNFVDRNGAQAVPLNTGAIRWNAFWGDVRGHLFDASRAKQILAIYSESHLVNAQGRGYAAATTATLLDIVGGYIPGTPASENQGLAQLGWSLLFIGGARVFPAAANVLGGLSYGRTAGSAVINSFEGKTAGALLDLTSMGLHVSGTAAESALAGFQHEFPFTAQAAQREALYPMLSSVAPLSDAFGWGKITRSSQQHIARWSPGGEGPPPSNGGLSPVSPSPVGGVYLGGAGAVLEGLGELKGIAVDEATGRLVLIASDEQRMDLPPLRVADIVTVFRAVYDHGESPSVTIDPDERNPKGPIMHVKHGPGTDGTYVGWILFEADRLMKTYQLGVDNVTRDVVNSRVLGHEETVEQVYFGDTGDEQTDATWERFWIVPAAVNRFDAASGSVSLFELPLKVNTQKMRWEDGKLVDDEDGESSVGAMAFKTWFSEHYEEIADEVLLTPPAGSGLDAPVAIFHELRRIAVIAAVAERLRDLGHPMPAWMRDYAVAPFPVSETTPSLTIRKSKEIDAGVRIASIYGGVNLAPADRDVRVYGEAQVADATSVRIEDLPFIDSSKREAEALTRSMPLLRTPGALGRVSAVELPGGREGPAGALAAAVLPGASSRALGPNRQQATDLEVPMGMGRSIQLTRFYNSFFDPSGALGRGWTLDLPRLLMTQVPLTRDGKRSEYRVVPQLISPLGSLDVRFDGRELVEPYGVEMFVAQDHPEIAGVTGGRSAILDAETHQILFHEGTEWHFDADGWLVLEQRDGTATRYVRDSLGRIRQLVGYVGTNAVAEIALAYDQKGRIVEATAGQADYLQKQAPTVVSSVRFAYNADGRLTEAKQAARKAGESAAVESLYAYEGGHLAKIQSEQMKLSFSYDDRGQLLWQEQDGRRTDYAVSSTEQGTVFTQNTAGSEPGEWTFDMRMRPVRADLGGGETLDWEYGPDETVVETVSQAGEPILTRTTGEDGRTETIALTDGPAYTTVRDEQGRPTNLAVGGVPAAELSWGADGTLRSLRTAGTEVQPRRHADGWPNGVLISAPMESGTTTQWQEEEWDVMGRPIKVTDASGFEYVMEYDDQGRLRTYGRVTEEGGLTGATLVYDSRGLITDIQSSWGQEQRQYDAAGVLRRVERERQGAKSLTSFDARGRQATRSDYDGGTTTWRYASDAAGASLLAIELPNQQRIDYVSSEGSADAVGRRISLGPATVSTVSDELGRVIRVTWGGR